MSIRGEERKQKTKEKVNHRSRCAATQNSRVQFESSLSLPGAADERPRWRAGAARPSGLASAQQLLQRQHHRRRTEETAKAKVAEALGMHRRRRQSLLRCPTNPNLNEASPASASSRSRARPYPPPRRLLPLMHRSLPPPKSPAWIRMKARRKEEKPQR